MQLFIAIFAVSFTLVFSFSSHFQQRLKNVRLTMVARDVEKLSVPLGQNKSPTDFTIRPIFEKSTFFTKTYKLPFSLNIEKPPKGFPAPIVTKDSLTSDGERVGDVLRATTAWAQNFNNGGAFNDITSFAGSIKWRNCVFDTTGAPWDDIIKALTSNNGKSDDVTLIFERPDNKEDMAITPKET